jgi:hypothetical protein
MTDKVGNIIYTPNGQVKQVVFTNGNTTVYYYNERNIKIKSKFTDVVASPNIIKYNWYITDVSGALKSVYEREDSVGTSSGVAALTNRAIYGGGRLGMYNQLTGKLNYELTDHLGNVRATVLKKDNGDLEMTSWSDYYPFGEVLQGRS